MRFHFDVSNLNKKNKLLKFILMQMNFSIYIELLCNITLRDISDIHPAVDQRKPSLLADKLCYVMLLCYVVTLRYVKYDIIMHDYVYFCHRIRAKSFKLTRPSMNIGRYKMVTHAHKSAPQDPER